VRITAPIYPTAAALEAGETVDAPLMQV